MSSIISNVRKPEYGRVKKHNILSCQEDFSLDTNATAEAGVEAES